MVELVDVVAAAPDAAEDGEGAVVELPVAQKVVIVPACPDAINRLLKSETSPPIAAAALY